MDEYGKKSDGNAKWLDVFLRRPRGDRRYLIHYRNSLENNFYPDQN